MTTGSAGFSNSWKSVLTMRRMRHAARSLTIFGSRPQSLKMTDGRVVKASYHNIRPLPTRGQVQIILEIPIEEMASLIAKLGVPAMPGKTKWVAVALLDELVASETERQHKALIETQKAKDLRRSLDGKERYANSTEMEQARTRAAFLAKDPRFQRWSDSRDEEEAAWFIRHACRVDSRSYIATDQIAYRHFIGMEARYVEETGLVAENRG